MSTTLYLATQGKNFGFVDSDKVEISNLSRQLYSFNDIGKLKVFRAKKICSNILKI